MTNPLTPQQADREAAARIQREVWGSVSGFAKAIEAGEGDNLPLVQIVAHHAQQARLEERERCAAIAEDRAPVVQCMSVAEIVEACTDIASKIREGGDV